MVAFGDVTILEFPIILGDNPGCSGGAPITIGWKPCGMPETHDVDMYEYMVKKEKSDGSASKKKSDSTTVKKISVQRRAQILMAQGYTLSQIANAVMKVNEIQKQRAESIQANGLGERMQLLMETTQRLPAGMIKGVLKGLSSKGRQKTIQARSA